jgi:catechol 2,3-dioxygenase
VAQPEFKLPPDLKMGPVCLRTKNLDAMLSFYENDLGLKAVRSDETYTALGTRSGSEPILILHQDENASTAPPNAAGLYHYALLVPDRRSLSTTYLTLGNKGVVIDGYADHQVSEALYLTDPDGNGIEIYRDRPKSEWKFDEGGVEMTTEPLDLDSLIKESPSESRDGSTGIVEGTKVGHMHLKVSDLQNSLTFYVEALGFELMRYWGSAAFLSAGGYHHHVGMNTWESLEGPPNRKTWIGLEYFAITLPETNLSELTSRLAGNCEVQEDGSKRLFVSDPDDINLIFKTA